MNTLVQHMTHAAMAERLSQLAAELHCAVDEGDLARVSRLDHAMRSAVIALVGGAPLVEEGADWRLSVLTGTLEAVRGAAQALAEQSRARADRERGALVYLTHDRRRGRR